MFEINLEMVKKCCFRHTQLMVLEKEISEGAKKTEKDIKDAVSKDRQTADDTTESKEEEKKESEAAVKKAVDKQLGFTLRDPTDEEYRELHIMRLNWQKIGPDITNLEMFKKAETIELTGN